MRWPRSTRGSGRAESTAELVAVLLSTRPRPWSYLEIGIASGLTFVAVTADCRVGVDPYPEDFDLPVGSAVHRVPSSEYFSSDAPRQEGPFDVIFVDGLHLWEAALEDALCAFEHLAPGGFVVIDDVFPSGRWEGVRAETYEAAVSQARAHGYELSAWMGDVWRAVKVLTHANIRGLNWVTLQVTKTRFHTVLWWADPKIGLASVRDSIDVGLRERVGIASVESLGGFTIESMPNWYRFEGYRKFSERIARRRRFRRETFGSSRRVWTRSDSSVRS